MRRVDRMPAQRTRAIELRLVDADARLEPQAPVVDEGDRRRRDVADRRRQPHDVVERLFRRRVEDRIAVERRLSLGFARIEQQGGGAADMGAGAAEAASCRRRN